MVEMSFISWTIIMVALMLVIDYHGTNGTPMTSTSSTVNDSAGEVSIGTVLFSILTDTAAECDVGLIHGGVRVNLEYRQINGKENTWMLIDVIQITNATNTHLHHFNSTFMYSNTLPLLIQFRLIQWEHNGGNCNCWGVASGNWTVEEEEDDRGHHMIVQPG